MKPHGRVEFFALEHVARRDAGFTWCMNTASHTTNGYAVAVEGHEERFHATPWASTIVEALAIAAKSGQLAVYDLENREEIRCDYLERARLAQLEAS